MTMKTSALLTVAVSLFCTASVFGRNPTGRIIVGKVAGIDPTAQSFVFQPRDAATPQTVRWIKRTRFVAGEQFAPASALASGSAVEVVLHQPIFGKPFVTKVTFLTTTTNHTKQTRK